MESNSKLTELLFLLGMVVFFFFFLRALNKDTARTSKCVGWRMEEGQVRTKCNGTYI